MLPPNPPPRVRAVCIHSSDRSRGRSFLDRKKLDRRRLECAHFKYAVLHVAGWYPHSFSQPITFYPDIKETLVNVTPGYQKAFHTFYSGMHKIIGHIILILVFFTVFH